jgi:hypothetical protein
VPDRFDQVKREAGTLFLRLILIALFSKSGAAPATVGKSNLID